MTIFIQQLINGLSNTSVVLLSALGMAVIFGIMNVVNLAHGELIMIGAYITCYVTYTLKLPFLVAMLISTVITGCVGFLIEKIVVKHLYSRVVETMLATFGVSLILKEIIRFFFGNQTPQTVLPISGKLTMGKFELPFYNLFMIFIALAVLGGTFYLFYRTRTGKMILGITQNRKMCECLGINSARIDTMTFVFGSALAGLAGSVMAPIKNISIDMGTSYLSDAFMTVVVGGINSLAGTAVGSLIIGEPAIVLGGFMSEITAKILVLALVIVFIRFRPEGLAAKEKR